MLPTIPDWTAIHPLVVHVPIALGMCTPIFWLAYTVFPKLRLAKEMAMVSCLIATAGAFSAVGSGRASAELVERTDAVSETLEKHVDHAEATRTWFLLSSCLLVSYAFLDRKMWPRNRMTRYRILPLVILATTGAGTHHLVWAGHYGGELVHKHGVHVDLGK